MSTGTDCWRTKCDLRWCGAARQASTYMSRPMYHYYMAARDRNHSLPTKINHQTWISYSDSPVPESPAAPPYVILTKRRLKHAMLDARNAPPSCTKWIRINQTQCILYETLTENQSKWYIIWYNSSSRSAVLQYIGKTRAKSAPHPPKQHNSSKPSIFIRKINGQSTKSVWNIPPSCAKWIEMNQTRCIYKEPK